MKVVITLCLSVYVFPYEKTFLNVICFIVAPLLSEILCMCFVFFRNFDSTIARASFYSNLTAHDDGSCIVIHHFIYLQMSTVDTEFAFVQIFWFHFLNKNVYYILIFCMNNIRISKIAQLDVRVAYLIRVFKILFKMHLKGLK